MSYYKTILEANSKYSINIYGQVKNNKTNHILKQHIDKNGYFRVCLWDGNKILNRSVHRLICIYFLDNPENKQIINHIDGNKQNNNINNLEWVTIQENSSHAWSNDLMKNASRPGTKHHNCKLTINDVKSIKEMVKQNIPRKEIAKKFNIHKNHIYRIITNKRWGKVKC